MLNFHFHAPTDVTFGKDTHHQVGSVIKKYGYSKIMLHYGGGSIKKNGIYDAVMKSLSDAGIEVIDFGGAEPNPKLSFVEKGAKICKEEGVELVLAVGGGSAIDSAKEIAVGAKYDGSTWDFSSKIKEPIDALPVGVILTLSASGSEMSASAVITNEENGLKRGYNSEFHRPLFAICNPELTYTVDRFQTGCGIVDIMMHTLERYFSKSPETPLTDALAEGLLKQVVAAGTEAIMDPENYEARADLMWASSLSHNDITGCGRDVFLTCHQLEHELSGKYDFVAHGAGLSIIFPAWAEYVYKHNLDRFTQYAKEVWDIPENEDDPEEAAIHGIVATKAFFAEIGMPTRLSQLGIGEEAFEEMAEKCTNYGKRILPGNLPLGKKEIIDIFKLAL